MTIPKRWLVLAAAVAVLSLLGALFWKHFETVQPMAPIELLSAPRPIEDFSLTSSDGQAFTKAHLQGAWTVAMVGFTSCPDICPTTMTVLKAVRQRLSDSANRPRFLLISVDPQRDRPDRLDTYVKFFDPAFIAATGRITELDKLARSLGFTYERIEGASPGSYTIDHSSSLILIDPQARLAGYFRPPFQVHPIANRLRNVLATLPEG